MFEIEVQNETHQTQAKLKFLAVPRIGEGIRVMEQDGYWASYDVLDLWYEKAEYGDVWVPFLHIRKTRQNWIPARCYDLLCSPFDRRGIRVRRLATDSYYRASMT